MKTPLTKLSTAQIGRCGELLFQFRLLEMGIESAPMTTDTGIDLVAYSKKKTDSVTIQVKACLEARPGGGRGRLAIDWWIPQDCPANFVGLVHIQTAQAWLFTKAEITTLAQQRPEGRLHFYMTTDSTAKARKDEMLHHDYDFQRYLIQNAVPRLGL